MKHYYKYRSLSGPDKIYTGRAIIERELKFTHARKFNDPFDCLPILTLECTKREFEIYLDGFFDRQHPGIKKGQKRQAIKEIIADPSRNHKSQQVKDLLDFAFASSLDAAGVLCLSSDPSHILMWSHYADSHRGICLQFECDPTDHFFSYASNVSYSDERPSVNLISDPPDQFQNKALFTKASHWIYEEEFRIVTPKFSPGIHKYPAEALTGIILGAFITEEDRQSVINWTSSLSHKVNLLQAKIHQSKYIIEIENL